MNLKDDEASIQGTLVVRYLVQKLQEAMSNLMLAPMAQALMKESQKDKQAQAKEESTWRGGGGP